MSESEKEILVKAIKTYGIENQLKKLLEEMSELQKEICKRWFGESNLDHIAEETADLEIMLVQLKMMLGIGDRVREYQDQKLERLKGNLEKSAAQRGLAGNE